MLTEVNVKNLLSLDLKTRCFHRYHEFLTVAVCEQCYDGTPKMSTSITYMFLFKDLQVIPLHCHSREGKQQHESQKNKLAYKKKVVKTIETAK